MQQLNVAIGGDLNGAVFEPCAHNVDGLRLQRKQKLMTKEVSSNSHSVTNILAEERVSFNPPTNVERQQAIAATEAKRQPVPGQSVTKTYCGKVVGAYC